MIIAPFSPEDYHARKILSARDVLLLGVDTALLRVDETFQDISSEEYNWEPLSETERQDDIGLPAEKKRVWRVFKKNGVYVYDYAEGNVNPPPFTTITWIMNHIAQTADMYLYCIKTGIPEGDQRTWDDLPVCSQFAEMFDYVFLVLQETKDYLASFDESSICDELNKLTPAPWGELRPTFLNLWGGIIVHTLEHAMQVAARKESIRKRY